MQFDGFLSVQEQKWLENHEIDYIGAAELPLRFPRCAPLLGWRHLLVAHKQSFIRHLSVSPVPNLGKTTRSPKSDLTPWILTLLITIKKLSSTFD